MKKTKKQLRKEKQQTAQQRKVKYAELFTLGKSFIVWIAIVVLFTFDANYWHTFTNIVVDASTSILDFFGVLTFTPVNILSKQIGTIEILDVYYASVTVAGYRMNVELECTSYHSFIAVFALVLFAKWSVKDKFIRGGIMAGILLLVNNIRLILLGVVGRHYPQLFNTFHDYVWNILLLVIIWLIWEKFNQLELKKIELKKAKLNEN